MKKLLIAVLFLVCVQASFAQTDSYIENVKHYLIINGTQEQYEGAIDGMFMMLKKQFKQYKVSEADWKELQSNKKQQVDDVKAILVSAYKALFHQCAALGSICDLFAKLVFNHSIYQRSELTELKYTQGSSVQTKMRIE